MPLPLIVPIGAGLAGLFGFFKSINAMVTKSEANDIAKSAEDIVTQCEISLLESRDACNTLLSQYGEAKLGLISNEVQDFVDFFGQLRKVDLRDSPELDRLKAGNFSEITIEDLKSTCSFASDLFSSVASGITAGTVTAFGAYGATVTFASAGTGTAISTLGGAAATNATLAWLGGGTIAAGGYGVAGGMVVLGVFVAGPCLFVLGGVMGAKAQESLALAKENHEMSLTFKSETEVLIQKLEAIMQVSEFAIQVTKELRTRMQEFNNALKNVIQSSGIDYSYFSDEEKAVVFQAAQFASLVKSVIDAPILKQDGDLCEDAEAIFSRGRLLALTGHSTKP